MAKIRVIRTSNHHVRAHVGGAIIQEHALNDNTLLSKMGASNSVPIEEKPYSVQVRIVEYLLRLRSL